MPNLHLFLIIILLFVLEPAETPSQNRRAHPVESKLKQERLVQIENLKVTEQKDNDLTQAILSNEKDKMEEQIDDKEIKQYQQIHAEFKK